jgi:class 3 adenylate cyclase
MPEHGRKIATILAADVVEYSRLMNVDDEGTLAALNLRRAIFNRLVREFDGREFGSVGDSLMAEFPSAVNAVRCARAIQQAVEKENESLRPNRRMTLRIGLNLGDVIEEGGAVWGRRQRRGALAIAGRARWHSHRWRRLRTREKEAADAFQLCGRQARQEHTRSGCDV